MNRVTINQNLCKEVIAVLRRTWVPLDKEETTLPAVAPALRGNFFLLLVAICHQTSPRDRPPLAGFVKGNLLKGWDYLLAKLEQRAILDPAILTPEIWSSMSGHHLADTFRDDQLGYLLTDPDGRAALVNDLGAQMLKRDWQNVGELLASLDFRVGKILEALEDFRAFRDPVQKKSLFLISLLKNSGIAQFQDESALGPPVDYHEVRGHLRIGLVTIHDPDLVRRVMNDEEVKLEDDLAIRHAVFEAILLVAHSAQVTPSQLHYLYWNVFRSLCRRELPFCINTPADVLPKRYTHLQTVSGPNCCPFSLFCRSAGQAEPIKEHRFETDFY